jgi:phage host-nuclease inhibitor protein Gam
MTTRKKKLLQTPPTRAEAEEMMAEFRTLTLTRKGKEAEVELAVADARAKAQPKLTQIDDRLEVLMDALELWAMTNPKEFDEARSVDFPAGRVGFRRGNWTLQPLKNWTWAKVLDAMKGARRKWRNYLRVKLEVDRERLIAERETLKADFTAIGVIAVQEDTFFVDPAIEATPTRQVVTASEKGPRHD